MAAVKKSQLDKNSSEDTKSGVLREFFGKCSEKIAERIPLLLSPVLSSIWICPDVSCTEETRVTDRVVLTSTVENKDDSILKLDRTQFLEFVEEMLEQHWKSDVAMTMLGQRCMDEGEHHMAEKCFRSALKANSDNLMAVEHLRMLQETMIHRWHFHMLNDIQRNSAYSRAISDVIKTLQEKSVVIDIGCGTGLLR